MGLQSIHFQDAREEKGRVAQDSEFAERKGNEGIAVRRIRRKPDRIGAIKRAKGGEEDRFRGGGRTRQKGRKAQCRPGEKKEIREGGFQDFFPKQSETGKPLVILTQPQRSRNESA